MSQLIKEIVQVSKIRKTNSTVTVTNQKKSLEFAAISDYKKQSGSSKSSKEAFHQELFQESFDECRFCLDQLQDFVVNINDPDRLRKIENRLEYLIGLLEQLAQKNVDLLIEQIKSNEKLSANTACYLMAFIDLKDSKPHALAALEEVFCSKKPRLQTKLLETFSGKSKQILANINRISVGRKGTL